MFDRANIQSWMGIMGLIRRKEFRLISCYLHEISPESGPFGCLDRLDLPGNSSKSAIQV